MSWPNGAATRKGQSANERRRSLIHAICLCHRMHYYAPPADRTNDICIATRGTFLLNHVRIIHRPIAPYARRCRAWRAQRVGGHAGQEPSTLPKPWSWRRHRQGARQAMGAWMYTFWGPWAPIRTRQLGNLWLGKLHPYVPSRRLKIQCRLVSRPSPAKGMRRRSGPVSSWRLWRIASRDLSSKHFNAWQRMRCLEARGWRLSTKFI